MERTFVKLYFLFALLPVILLTACGGDRGRDGIPDREKVDSLLRSTMNSLYTSPARTDSLYAAVQQSLSDSVAWYRLELFRAVAHGFLGDTLWKRDAYRRVGGYCSAHPEASALEGQLWNHRGVDCSLTGDLEAAIVCYRRACRAYEGGEERGELVSANINLADAGFLSGRLPDAAKYYRRALFVADSLGGAQNFFQCGDKFPDACLGRNK